MAHIAGSSRSPPQSREGLSCCPQRIASVAGVTRRPADGRSCGRRVGGLTLRVRAKSVGPRGSHSSKQPSNNKDAQEPPQESRHQRSVTAQALTSSSRGAPSVPAPSRPYAEGDLPAPEWTGDRLLSRILNVFIGFGPLYAVMKQGARNVIIGSAEKNGIEWRRMAGALRETRELAQEKEALENKDLAYPEYYVQPFHAYAQGNLCWEAAYEVEPATLSLYRRAIPWATSTTEAERIYRRGWMDAIVGHHEAHSGGLPVNSVLDVGCSTGISTRLLAREYPDARVVGLDASPFFLAVAAYRAKQKVDERAEWVTALALDGAERSPERRIEWVHGLGESTPYPDHSFAMVSFAFVFHECPAYAITDLLKEARRILKPGGTVSMIDNSPRSKVIQSIPTPIAAMMKTTEPHIDSYYLLDLEGLLQGLGYSHVTSVLGDPRHRVITATA